MTNRTASLLMLFVLALVATGVLLSLSVAALEPRGLASPWLAPGLAAICQSGALYLGRRYILPEAVARSALRSAVTIMAMVAPTLALAVGATWMLQRLSGIGRGAASMTVIVWFGLLWWAVRRQHKGQ